MNLRGPSVVAFGFMMAGIGWLLYRQELLASSLPARIVQVLAVLLMIAARITFGRRSFHAAANPTAGALVTTGPYALLRHPIYAAILYFVWAAAFEYHSAQALAAAALLTAGAAVRMYAEETLLAGIYPEYGAYHARTARVVPFIL